MQSHGPVSVSQVFAIWSDSARSNVHKASTLPTSGQFWLDYWNLSVGGYFVDDNLTTLYTRGRLARPPVAAIPSCDCIMRCLSDYHSFQSNHTNDIAGIMRMIIVPRCVHVKAGVLRMIIVPLCVKTRACLADDYRTILRKDKRVSCG